MKAALRPPNVLISGPSQSVKFTAINSIDLVTGLYNYEDNRRIDKVIVLAQVTEQLELIWEAKKEPFMQEGGSALKLYSIEKQAQSMVYTMKYSKLESMDDWMADLTLAIKTVWECLSACKALETVKVNDLANGAAYFFGAMSRITEQSYLPNVQDILWAYVETTGIRESRYTIGTARLSFFDPGGTRVERMKWARWIDMLLDRDHYGIPMVFFFVDAGSYNEVSCEAPYLDRMEESFMLFDAVCKQRRFENAKIILFLHQMDRLERKPASIPFQDGYCYKGDLHSVEDVKTYPRDIFLRIYRRSRPGSDLEAHFTSINDAEGLES